MVEKVLLKSYTIPNIKYDLMLTGGNPNIQMEANVRVRTSKKDKEYSNIQIDIAGYTDKDNPFMELSIIGEFSISKEFDDEDAEERTNILKQEGLPILYQKLSDCNSQIIKILNISFPKLPEVDFNEYN